MKKRYSLWTLMAVSFITAAAVTATLAWSGAVRKGQGVDIVRAKSPAFAAERASWFKPESAARPSQPGSFADLAERVQKAVVNISTSKKVRAPQMITPMPHGGPRDPFQDFFDKFFDEGMPRQQTQHSLGSGFIIDKDGTILTNNHVVSQADEIEVVLSDGRKFKAKVVGTDEKSDIAVIKIKAEKDLPFVVLGTSKTMRPGDWVMAIGNPFGLEHTVTVGVISAMGRLIGGGPYAKFIQTDASINPGNSGGPLVNERGEAVGVNTAYNAPGNGIGFAIAINMVRSVVEQLIETGRVPRAFLGVNLATLDRDLAEGWGLADVQGVIVTEVQPGTPADQAGLREGDVIVKFDGIPVTQVSPFRLLVARSEIGRKVKMRFLREGRTQEREVELSERTDPAPRMPGPLERPPLENLGLVFSPGTGGEGEGVRIDSVLVDGPAFRSGIRDGDVVLEAGWDEVRKPAELRRAIRRIIEERGIIVLKIARGADRAFIAVRER